MPVTRQAAQELVAAGDLEVLQRGNVVDVTTVKGPIRLRLKQGAACPDTEPGVSD